MPNDASDIVTNIRKSSRNLVREFGFLNRTIAGTNLSASSVHALIEIGNAGTLRAKDLSEILLLEKSTVSRLTKSLIKQGEIHETISVTDTRQKDIHLTIKGEETLITISNYAEKQVSDAVSSLKATTKLEILNGLETYSEALKASRLSQNLADTDNSSSSIKVMEGYSPGLMGRITEMHALYYSNFAGFDEVFEATVARGISDFIPRINHTRNTIWYAVKNGKIVGSIAIDGEDLSDNVAHLRWFIVDKEARGSGVGRELFALAMSFCDSKAFRETHLWTFKGLDAARNLYENSNFSLTEENLGDQWGKQVLEQKFVRLLPC